MSKIKRKNIKTKKTSRIIGYFILLVLMVFSVPCHGRQSQPLNLNDAEQAWLAQNHTVRVRVSHFPPYILLEGTKITGLVIDYLNLIAQRTGVRFDFVPETRPWQEALQSLMNRQGPDLMTSLSPMAERKPHMIFSDPYIVSPRVIFIRKDAGVISSTDELRGRTLAVPHRTMVHKRIEVEYPDIELLIFDTDAESIRAVSMGEADAYIGNLINTSFEIIRKGFINLKVAAPTSLGDDIYTFGIRRDWPELNSIINKALGAMTREAELAIRSKWLTASGNIVTPQRVSLTPEERDWLKAHPGIRIGLPEGLEPYVMADQQGKQSGILVDFKDELNRTLGTNLILKTMPSSKILEMSKKREIDIIYAVEPYKAEQEDLLQTNVWAVGYPAVYARQELSFKTPEDMVGKTVVLRPNMAWDNKIVQPYEKSVKIVYAETPLDAMKMILNKEADIYIGLTSHKYAITKYRLFGIAQAYMFPDTQVPLVMGVRSDWPELVPILNKGLANVGKEGLRAIVAKWLQKAEKESVIELTPEEKAWLSENHTVRVRFTSWPPFFIDDSGEYKGITIDYLNLIAERTGVKFSYVPTTLPWPEALEKLKNHDDEGPDLISNMMPTAERERYITFSKDYIRSPRVIFTRNDGDYISGIDSLFGKTIAAPRGTLVHKKLKAEYPDINLSVFDSDGEAIAAVASGKADAYIGNLTLASHQILKKGLTNLKVAAPSPFGDHIFHFGIRNDWPELGSIINKGIDTISKEDHAAIRNRYLSVRYEYGVNTAVVLKWILVVVGASSGIVLLFFYWNRSLAKKVQERTEALTDTNISLELEITERTKAEDALRESRDYLENLTDSIGDAIFLIKMPDRTIEWLNDSFNILGYEPAECIGRTTEFLYPSKEGFFAFGEKMTPAIAEEKGFIHTETTLRKKSGENFPADITLSFNRIKGDVVSLTAIVRDISERKQAEFLLQNYQKRLKSLASQLIVTEEKERRRIAEGLHDQVGQSLALARMQLIEIMETKSALEKKILVKDVSNILLRALKDTRSLIFDLSSPSMNEIGLGAAISEWLEEHIAKKYSLKTEFVDNLGDDHRKNLDENVRALLFRNVRELLTNVVKHARANTVSVRLTHKAFEMKIVVEDDGVGFDPEAVHTDKEQTSGYGLFSIQERMTNLGGTFDIQSGTGKGCRVTLTLPVEKMR